MKKIDQEKLQKYGIWALVIIAIFVFFNWVIMPWYTSGSEVVVPNLIGKTEAQAQELIKQSKLDYKIAGYKYDERFPKGVIAFQKPKPNAKVKEDRRIYVFLSSGEKMVSVPSLKGKSLREAKLLLESIGLGIAKIDTIPSYEYPAATVVSQNYLEGTQIKSGSSIALTVTSRVEYIPDEEINVEPNKVRIPNLVGKSLSEARSAIEGLGLKVGKVSYQPSFSLLPNTIIDQYPSKGNIVFTNTSIDLFVTKDVSTPSEIKNNESKKK